jgi:tetratricopeptide (TPR) repeat protein
MGHYCHFTAAFYRGELREAEAHFVEWEALNRVREYEERAVIANAYSNAAILALQLGDEAEAERRIECAQAHAFAVDNPFDRCTCLMMGALLNVFRNNPTKVEDLAAASVKLAQTWNFAQVEGWAGAALGWARAQLGSAATGTEILRSNLLSLAKSETRVSMPFFLTMLAEAQALSGDAEAALTSFEEALSVCPPERLYRPHTLTCLGEHLASLGRWDEAEAAFREAVATAEMMAAKAAKARASAGLAKLRRSRRPGSTGPA